MAEDLVRAALRAQTVEIDVDLDAARAAVGRRRRRRTRRLAAASTVALVSVLAATASSLPSPAPAPPPLPPLPALPATTPLARTPAPPTSTPHPAVDGQPAPAERSQPPQPGEYVYERRSGDHAGHERWTVRDVGERRRSIEVRYERGVGDEWLWEWGDDVVLSLSASLYRDAGTPGAQKIGECSNRPPSVQTAFPLRAGASWQSSSTCEHERIGFRQAASAACRVHGPAWAQVAGRRLDAWDVECVSATHRTWRTSPGSWWWPVERWRTQDAQGTSRGLYVPALGLSVSREATGTTTADGEAPTEWTASWTLVALPPG